MFSRVALKQDAKSFLRKFYWPAFFVCLLTTLLTGGGSSGANSNEYQDQESRFGETTVVDDIADYVPFETDNQVVRFATRRFNSPLLFLTGGALILTSLLIAILLITVGFAVEVGQSRFFLKAFDGEVYVRNLFSTFNSQEYLPIVKTQFLKNVYIFLWTLLLIIPGIIKSYEYRFVPYILAENPLLSSEAVLARSKEITDGHKMEIFVLDLSFIGWYLLGGLAFGIGGFFVDPYAEATNARLYEELTGRGYPEEVEEEEEWDF